ncbi:hypothetical protein CVT24_008221 [Panaeolus cyanescens]|uniref:Uncharacterized protein n=1 Tax=Panaeolus cyanescens TaxID=181874 RepID=A0A409YR32_9AGAR|nr:hypothetical protein CVT24_008221 [Panaeolus cyanescens]
MEDIEHQSYNQSLKEVHLPSTFKQTHLDHDVADNDSHFHEALEHWRQLSLAPSFVEFAKKADGLSASMPLLLHHWREIYDLWVEVFNKSDDEGLRPLLDLLQKMAHDLRTTLSPIYSDVVHKILHLLTRSISASALTSLLETLSSLFRYLLVPAISFKLLEETWDMVTSILPKCLGEIQRAFAEVWGGTLRRLKAGPRERAMTLLAERVEGLEDASAWVVVFACKSVSQTLHTCTPSIFAPILAYHLSATNPAPTHTLLRRSLTALIHHVKTADQFSILGELLLQSFTTTVTDLDLGNAEQLERARRSMDIMSVVCAVRQGSRLTSAQVTKLFSQLNSLPVAKELHAAMLLFCTSLLIAGEMSLWLGPGLKFLQQLWAGTLTSAITAEEFSTHPLAFTLKLNLCLSDSGWGGWKMVALPLVMRSTLRSDAGLAQYAPRQLLAFAASLKREKNITPSDSDTVWRTKLETLAMERLQGGKWKEGNTVDALGELDDILTLSPFFNNAIAQLVVDIIASSIDGTDSTWSKLEASKVLGLCLQNLAKRNASEWMGKVNFIAWTKKAAEKWGWSHEVLGGLVALSHASPPKSSIPMKVVYPHLREGVSSHSRPLRLATLRFLDSKLVDSSHDFVEVLKRCLQGEEVSLDVQGVRERVLRIGRVGQVVGSENGADLCARWLIAQLKVNLRPLWSPAAAAISALGSRFGDLVWKLLFSELQLVTTDKYTINGSEQTRDASADLNSEHGQGGENSGQTEDDVDPWEEERSWRDPSAHNIRSIVWAYSGQAIHKGPVKEDRGDDRLDLRLYEHQLLVTFGECSSLIEKHNRDLIPHFLSLSGADVTINSASPSALSKAKLIAWLTLFSKFANPKALYSTETLYTLYMALLSHPDRGLQNIALSCIFTYKSPHLTPYEDRFKALLDDTRWREELTKFDMEDIPQLARSEVMSVFIRLLFGVMLEKKGRRGGGGGGADRRAAVLSTLAGCTDDELGILVDLMLRPFGMDRSKGSDGTFTLELVNLDDGSISEKQVIGFLTLLGDVLKNLGSRLIKFWPALIGVTINLTSTAQQRIMGSNENTEEQEEDAVVDEEQDEVEAPNTATPASSSKSIRSIRQLGLKQFADFFRLPVEFEFSPFVGPAFAALITPRLPNIDKENTQSPSSLLDLLYAWSLRPSHVPYLVTFNADTLPRIYDCLIATNVKPSVISRIFDIVENLLGFSSEDASISDHVLKPYVTKLLTNLSILVERTKGTAQISTPLAQRQIGILSEIAPYSTQPKEAVMLLSLFNPLLRKPAKIVPEKMKVNLIKIIGDLMHLVSDLTDQQSATYMQTYDLLSYLFQSLRSRPARIGLVSTFDRLAALQPSLRLVSDLLTSMNAYSTKRMDEPDFNRRLAAFSDLNENLYKSLSCSDWLPILYNMLNFIQDPNELAVRNSASYAMRHFIDYVADGSVAGYTEIFMKTLFPGLKNGLRSKNEMVRVEVLGVIAYSVEKCEKISMLQEMRVLLEAGDEEANFFNNILHIQVHRRSRALRRLADHCDEGHLRSITLNEIFIPLVANYIQSTAAVDHHLVTDAIYATGKMAKQLAWGPYHALVQKYIKLSRSKDESERVYIRALVALLDNFHFSMEDAAPVQEEVAGDAADDDEEVAEVTVPAPVQNANNARIADAVNLRLLPNLLNHLEKHDASTASTDDNNRIPLAIGIVSVAKHLPDSTRDIQITRLITILSQILRSKSQETRDLTRDALNRIAVSLGASYLPIILRELRAALLRGPQLHVLAYVVHSLIIHITTGDHASSFTVLDDCVNDVAHVSAEVIFGESGKDVQAEDFKTKMREVRGSSSRGLDTFTTIAKFITPPKISSLLVPLKAIMHETESIKVMNLVEEVLKRIAVGLNGNEHLVPTELIVLCNTLISQNAKFLQQVPIRKKNGPKNDAIVQMKRQTKAEGDHYAHNSFRFVTFGLDLLNTALRRNRFDFHDTSVTSRLEAIVVVVGNTLYSSNASVLMLGMRCAAGLAKCPLKSMDKNLPVFVKQILDIIKQAGGTESELVQIAFKSLATILRDGPPIQVKEKDLVFLLELVSPDLEEPSRQAAVFALLRAIVARKFVVPEIYDLMEKVSEIAVTSQSPQVQELCRGVLLQFLLDYPQGKGRLRNQMTFLAKNLSYIHESGRTSILELLSAIIVKFQQNLIVEYADLLFVALVMVVANDESPKCREMAAQLIKSLWVRLKEDQQTVLLSHLHTWSTQTAQPVLVWVSAQVFGFIVDAAQQEAVIHIPTILEDLNSSLAKATFKPPAADEDDMQVDVEIQWQLPYHSLTAIAKVLRHFSHLATQDGAVPWPIAVDFLLFPHAWVRTAACRLIGMLFTAVPAAAPSPTVPDNHPLSRKGMQETARNLTQQLKSENLDETLSLQIVKNLFYLGKCFLCIPFNEATEGDTVDDNGNDQQPDQTVNPLPWLFSKLSYQIRSGHIARRSRAVGAPNWSQQPLACLRWFAAMVSYMEGAVVEKFLVHMLTPIYRLAEDDTIRDSQMDELKTTAIELQDLVQSKVGTTKFATVYNQIRQGALGIQRERKVARALQATVNPEAAAKRKIQRNVIKKESRKRKERVFAESKGRNKRARQE